MSLNAATLCWQAVSRLTETLKSVTDAREDLETSLAAAQVRASSTYNPFKSQQAQRQLSHFGPVGPADMHTLLHAGEGP